MPQKKIELRQRLDLGGLITIYFDFLKQNFKNFTNIFISYNGIFILSFLGISYLLVTGFIGVFGATTGLNTTTTEIESGLYLGFGVFLYLIVFIIVAALNYSLSSSYISLYVSQEHIEIEKKTVWEKVKNNLSNIIVFVLLLLLIYVGFFILSFILAIIPILGTIAQYILSFAMTSWFGISFMVMLHEKKGVTDSFSEGWNLVIKNFWKCVGVNLIIGILTAIILILVLSIPGILVGIYTFHAVETNVDLMNSVVAKIIWIVAFWIFLIVITYSQALTQFINGILYFSLHEQTYNDNTRAKIEQIGSEL